MKRTYTVLILCFALMLGVAPVSAQEGTTTPTPTATPEATEQPESFTAIDPSTRILDYSLADNGVMTLRIESDIPRTATVIGLVAGEPGVSQLSFKRVSLSRGINEVKLQTEEVNGKRGVAIAVGNSAVTVVEKTSISLFDEAANWDGIRSGFLTGIVISFATIGVIGYKKRQNFGGEPERVL